MEQRHQRGDVVALEGVDVAGDQRLLLGRRWRPTSGGPQVVVGQGGPRPLQRAVHRRHGGVEQLGHLGRLPAQHLAQDQHGPLAGGQVLEGGDEGEADGLPRRRHLGRIVGVVEQDLAVGDGLDPRVLGAGHAEEGLGAAGAARGPSAGRGAGGRRSMSRQTLVAMR